MNSKIQTKILCIFDIWDSRTDIPLFHYIFWCWICLNDLFSELCNSWINFPIFSDVYDFNLNEITEITVRSVRFVCHLFIGFTYFNYCSIGFTTVSHCLIGCTYVSYSLIGLTYVSLQACLSTCVHPLEWFRGLWFSVITGVGQILYSHKNSQHYLLFIGPYGILKKGHYKMFDKSQ